MVGALREEARREGFTRVGVARASQPPRFDRFLGWISAGRHAGMDYLARSRETRSNPESLLPGAKSVVCLAAPHSPEPFEAPDGSRFARYARGSDYHGTLRDAASRAAERTRNRLGGEWRYRVCVDSVPLVERSFAAVAGLGWIGKNGCLIDPVEGSYFLLAEILTDLDLPPDEPVAERCGSCVRCLEACPTGAFLEPGLLDAARCLAYWTIEHRGAIPDAWKEAIGQNVFGCDICQEVCPWNGPLASADSSPGRQQAPTRAEMLEMGRGEWRRRFGASAVNRAGWRGLQRNAAASAGSTRESSCLPVLPRAASARTPGLSDAARWALGRLNAGRL